MYTITTHGPQGGQRGGASTTQLEGDGRRDGRGGRRGDGRGGDGRGGDGGGDIIGLLLVNVVRAPLKAKAIFRHSHRLESVILRDLVPSTRAVETVGHECTRHVSLHVESFAYLHLVDVPATKLREDDAEIPLDGDAHGAVHPVRQRADGVLR